LAKSICAVLAVLRSLYANKDEMFLTFNEPAGDA
jgi:hypothetical protein